MLNQHPQTLNLRCPLLILLVFLILVLPACAAAPATPVALTVLNILIAADGQQHALQVQSGTTVQAALEKAGVKLNQLDRIDPPGFSLLTKPVPIRVVRVTEEFRVEEEVTAFESKILRNESLPKGEKLLVQSGQNGLKQVTYRRVLEDGVQVSNLIFKTVNVREPRPEIMMVGVQMPFVPIDIPGRLAYITAGNAWLMEKNTGTRKPLVTTGDLDGRVFSLSNDGVWLLYTRKAGEKEKDTINTLWMLRVTDEKPVPVNLGIKNIIHYAGWVPGGKLTIAYSTVESRLSPPGWQANNDLWQMQVGSSGAVAKPKEYIKTNFGSVYGWWGTGFSWSPDGKQLAFTRSNGVGLVDLKKGEMVPALKVLEVENAGNWAWLPGISWSPDGSVLYTVNHLLEAGENSAEENKFDLTAIWPGGETAMTISENTGMFAYPAVSPAQENGYWLAYLQARTPQQSDTSTYSLMVSDRDGSNAEVIFPNQDQSGLEPQQVVWSPAGFSSTKQSWVGVVYKGNLFFVDPLTKESQQVTGDGSISRLDWK